MGFQGHLVRLWKLSCDTDYNIGFVQWVGIMSLNIHPISTQVKPRHMVPELEMD